MIEVGHDGNATSVKAIDSDFCLGPEPGDPKDMVGKHGVHLPGLPPVIDTDMRDATNHMDDGDIDRIMGDMFDDKSVQAAKDRLAALKTHVTNLGLNGNIIAPDQWGSEATTRKLKAPENGEPTNYWARDRRYFERAYELTF